MTQRLLAAASTAMAMRSGVSDDAYAAFDKPLCRSRRADRPTAWPDRPVRILHQEGRGGGQTSTRGGAEKASPLAWKSSSRAIQIHLHATLTQPHSSGKPGYATPQIH